MALGLGVTPARAAEKSSASVARGATEKETVVKRDDFKSEAAAGRGSVDKATGAKSERVELE